MKLYKKIFDFEEAIGNGFFTDIRQAEKLQTQLTNSWNQCKELWMQLPSITADLIVSENGIKKILKFISFKDYRNRYNNSNFAATASCFYQELSFSTNNIWENSKIW